MLCVLCVYVCVCVEPRGFLNVSSLSLVFFLLSRGRANTAEVLNDLLIKLNKPGVCMFVCEHVGVCRCIFLMMTSVLSSSFVPHLF